MMSGVGKEPYPARLHLGVKPFIVGRTVGNAIAFQRGRSAGRGRILRNSTFDFHDGNRKEVPGGYDLRPFSG
ncbi:hypothetical protein, partial [Desulfococcus multivorans]